MKKIICILGIAFLSGNVWAQKVTLVENSAEKKVDVSVDGKPFTSYIFPGPDKLKKAVLYPVRTAQGTLITRGWPMDPRPGERVDHPHHVGLWLNHGDVNGYDFWNSSDAVDRTKHKYGDIIHTGITTVKSGKKKGQLGVTADWVSQDGKTLLTEKTTYLFSASGDQRIIDRITTLTAVEDVTFNDSKEGLLGLRLARELEHPSKKPEVFTDANGVATKVASLNNEGVTGMYQNKEGVTGDDVWGKRSAWCDLEGTIGSEKVSVAILDHPANIGYPAYWHARGYGLYAINPMGDKEYSSGKEKARNKKLAKGESMTVRYRVVVASHHLSDSDMESLASDFSKVK
ncbi:DUF6807 domain-containing protein [Arundinibacter roseus]|uniref:Methane oxygenase PmoA n=1 Tax=Arundinibacter roseus TaxID=2070510 RepID=A0A4R4KFC5_9BACT|nr:PmoA family protein [Arundinibacter roseus]TDB65321.1 hypothetical protein EZE20_11525 [Arundinibacter roseus]